MEVLKDHPELDPAKGVWRKKHPPEMVTINGKMENVYVWIEKDTEEEDFATTKEDIMSILDELPDKPNTRALFAMIQAFITSTAQSP